MRSLLATAAALLVANAALADSAAPVVGRLEVDPALCFDRDALGTRIAHWTTRAIDPEVGLRVMRRGSRVDFALLHGAEVIGERSLPLPDAGCSDATDAVALAIALALDANAEDPPPRSSAPPSEQAPAAHPDVVPPPPPPKIPFSVSATGLALFGVLADAAPGVQIGLDKRWTRAFETHFAVFGLGRSDLLPYSASETFVTVIVAGVLDACLGVSVSELRLRGCAGWASGAVLSFTGTSTTSIPANFWTAPTLRLDLRAPLAQRLGVIFSVDAFASLFRPDRQAFIDGALVDAIFPALPEYGLAGGVGLAFDL